MRALLFLLLFFSANVALGVEAADVSAPINPAPIDAVPPIADPDADEFGGPIFLLALVVVALLVVLFVIGLGIAIGLAVLAAIAGMTAVGILSTSTIIAVVRRNPADGLRALFLQIGAAAGAFCGIVAAWLAPRLAEMQLPPVSPTLVLGAVAGLFCGAALGYLFNYAWGRAMARIIAQLEALR